MYDEDFKRIRVIIDEEWRDVTLYPIRKNMYEVSDYGRVRRKSTKRIKSQSYDKDGYLNTTLVLEEGLPLKSRPFRVHRLVANEFCPKADESFDVVNHKDEDKEWNLASNLEWCDVSYNTTYSYDTETNTNQGEDHYRNKFPINVIKFICENIDLGNPNNVIKILVYRKFGIDTGRDLIKDIRRCKTWRSVSKNYKFYKERKGSTTIESYISIEKSMS